MLECSESLTPLLTKMKICWFTYWAASISVSSQTIGSSKWGSKSSVSTVLKCPPSECLKDSSLLASSTLWSTSDHVSRRRMYWWRRRSWRAHWDGRWASSRSLASSMSSSAHIRRSLVLRMAKVWKNFSRKLSSGAMSLSKVRHWMIYQSEQYKRKNMHFVGPSYFSIGC